MGDHSPADNNTAEAQVEGRRGGIFISHGTAFVLLLLSVCLSVLVGLIVHFASPRHLVCTCNTPIQTVPPLGSEELKERCVSLINGGDFDVCGACPEDTTRKQSKATSTASFTTPTAEPNITTSVQEPEVSYRLPTAIRPHHYDLELQPEIYGSDPSSFTFNGSVSIIINVTENTSNITFHKQDLIVDSVALSIRAVDNKPSVSPSIVNVTYDEVRQFYVLHLDGDLDPERSYEIEMHFHANLTGEKTTGMYYKYYTTNDNETVYLVATMLEPTYARMAFPCFDEPALKATFDVTLVRKTTTGRNFITLSNTAIVSNEQRGEYIADMYETTPVMSTYLLAFVVCDFEYWENTTANITFRTYARPNGMENVRKLHQYGLDLFAWFEKSFEPDYPMKKIGISKQVYYQETSQEAGRLLETFGVLLLKAWFGNLVSPKWWSWLWLNEGFSTFLEFHALQVVYPQRRSMEQFVVTQMQIVLAADSSNNSHPVTSDVQSTEEIEEIFDAITYVKAACIVRMMHFVMGEELFFKGLNFYLQRHQYGAVEPDDLWDSLTQVTINEGNPMNISDIFDAWVTQMNYPLVTVRVVEPGVLNVRQQQFVSDVNATVMNLGTFGPHGYVFMFTDVAERSSNCKRAIENLFGNRALFYDSCYRLQLKMMKARENCVHSLCEMRKNHYIQERCFRWTIPFTYTTSVNMSNFNKVYSTSDIAWIHHSESEVNISDPIFMDTSLSDSWVLVNLHQTGYYRVNYDHVNWMALVKHLELNHKTIPPVNRAQIINDAWALQRTGHVKMEVALRTLNYLKDEMDFGPWTTFSREIKYLDAMLKRSDLYGAFREFMRVTTHSIYKKYRLNIDNEFMPEAVPVETVKVATTSGYACKYGVRECIHDAASLFEGLMHDPDSKRVDPNLLRVTTCTAISNGGVAEWNFAYDQYKKSEWSTIRSSILHGMACSKQTWLTERLLNMALNDTMIRKSDVTSLIRYISEETADTEIIWTFVKNNHILLSAYLEEEAFSEILKSVTYSFNTNTFLNELDIFAIMILELKSYNEQLQEATESTLNNIKWISDNHDVISDWLTERGFGKFLLSG